jgi:hypothetical protein
MGLPLDRLLVVTADGAEKAVADALTDLLREAKFNLIPAADDINWQDVAALLKVEYWWCGDHRLALVVRHGLEDPREGSPFVEHTRKFVLKGELLGDSLHFSLFLVIWTNKLRVLHDQLVAELKTPQLLHFSATRFAGAVLMGQRFAELAPVLRRLQQMAADSADETIHSLSALAFPDHWFSEWEAISAFMQPVVRLITKMSSQATCLFFFRCHSHS